MSVQCGDCVCARQFPLLSPIHPFHRKSPSPGSSLSPPLRFLLSGCAYVIRPSLPPLQHDIIHRDVKPENVLFSSTSSEEKLDVKIADFGCSLLLRAGRAPR